jgi:histone H3/H4
MPQRFVDAAAVTAEVEQVRALSGHALRRRWRAVFARPIPKHLTAELMRRMIATRIQEEAFGTLDHAALKFLEGLGRRDRSPVAERNLKIGTVLVRDHQGRRHTVTLAPEGYVWEGKPYSSLSAIARAITGTAWSGPRFFGLKSFGKQSNEQPDATHGRRRIRERDASQSTRAGTALPR